MWFLLMESFFETADTQEEALRDVKEHFNNIKED